MKAIPKHRLRLTIELAVLGFAVVGFIALALLPTESAPGLALSTAPGATANFLDNSKELGAFKPGATTPEPKDATWKQSEKVVFKYLLQQTSGDPATIVWTSRAETSVALEPKTAKTFGFTSQCNNQVDNEEICMIRNVPSGQSVPLDITGKVAVDPGTAGTTIAVNHKVTVLLVGDTLTNDARFETKELTTPLTVAYKAGGAGLSSCNAYSCNGEHRTW